MLKGSLDDFSLPDIFRLMSFTRKTGMLEVVRRAGTGKVYFRTGDVYYAESSLSREPLGQKLVRARVITDAQLRKALDVHAETRQRVGEILVTQHALTPGQLETALREQIEDAVFDLLRWELGEFAWLPEQVISVDVPITISVENLIMEASRRLDEVEVIRRKIPSEDSIFAMTPAPPEGAIEINITPDEWRVLVLVDGIRSVADIAALAGMNGFQAMRMMYGLVSAGLIVLSSDPGSEAPASQVPESLRTMPAASSPAPEERSAESRFGSAFTDAERSEPQGGSPWPSVPDTSAPQTSVAWPASTQDPPAWPQQPAPEQPAPEQPAPEQPAPEQPAPEQPAPTPTAEPEHGLEQHAAEDVPLEVYEPPPARPEPVEDVAPASEVPVSEEITLPESPTVEPEPTPVPEPVAEEPREPAPAEPEPVAHEPAESPTAEPGPERPAPESPAAEPPRAPEPADAGRGSTGSIDRAAAVRELAGLFDEPRARTSKTTPVRPPQPEASAEKAEDDRKRVEDDEAINRGLISRLIDGVKGL